MVLAGFRRAPALALLTLAAMACGPGGADWIEAMPADQDAAGALDGAADAATSAPSTQMNPGGTISFRPTLVEATRFSNVCGVMHPPFANGDIYFMDIVDQTGPAPWNSLNVSVTSPATVGAPLALAVQPLLPNAFGTGSASFAGQDAQEGTKNFTFWYWQGTDPAKLDTGAFDSVTVTILDMPSADGAPMTVRTQVHFVDGATLDETFSAPLSSESSSCPAG